MKYSIFYLIKGEAGKYSKKLVKEVGPKFKENYLIENPLPPHVTLVSSFETNKIKKIEEMLKEFIKKQKKSEIKINGFGNFNNFVVFLKMIFSKRALKIREQLIEELKTIDIKFSKLNRTFKPHSTIAYGNTKKSFGGIWDYLEKFGKPQFDLKLDNITIMKKGRRQWKVHKEFKIK